MMPFIFPATLNNENFNININKNLTKKYYF